jgi:hypothetical protein
MTPVVVPSLRTGAASNAPTVIRRAIPTSVAPTLQPMKQKVETAETEVLVMLVPLLARLTPLAVGATILHRLPRLAAGRFYHIVSATRTIPCS